MKPITIKDVARLAQVSISSVSRYLTDPTSIRPAAAISVNKAIMELNYIPNPFAQNLKSESTNIIAVILPDISDHFFSEACKAICNLFYMYNYTVMICDTNGEPEKERHYVDDMARNRCAGIMLVPCGKNTEYLKEVLSRFPRLMLFDRLEPGIPADMVSEDNLRSGYILTRHMLNQGHRRFVVLNGLENSVNMHYRLNGVRKALMEAGLTLEDEYSLVNLRSKVDAAQALERLVKKPGCPRCILACNTHLLEGIVIAASRMKLSVPDEYSLAGFSVDDPRHLFPFPVPAVVQNPAALGTQAGEVMLKRLRGNIKNSAPKIVMLDTKLDFAGSDR
ncbi:MAG: LacI family transcriptional regulator [Treponema sp.]|nr:LacI family transcriptional regulator [Treponema sp.]